MKITAYAELIDHPEFAFTRETLKAAALAFKWFPSFAELDEFLGNQGIEIRRMHYRLIEVSTATSDEEVAAKKAEEEAAKVRKMLETPHGRITHKWWETFWRRVNGVAWYEWKAVMIPLHGEEKVDAWHAEVAAMDWSKGADIFEDFDPLAALKACGHRENALMFGEENLNAWRDIAEKRKARGAA
jgi:hypothetical protein